MNNPSQLVTLRQNKQRLPVVVAITGLTEKLRALALIVSRPGLRDKLQQISMFVLWDILLNIRGKRLTCQLWR